MIDIDTLLEELDSAAPCGPNLEYDADFLALERTLAGKPEIQYGNSITAAVAPDWAAVWPLLMGLWARSRDLRLAVPLLRCALALQGLAGLRDGLNLIEQLLEERWETVHPQLDSSDDFDPIMRVNALAMLADPLTVLQEVKAATLLDLPGLGALTLRSLEIASGERAPAAGQEKISYPSISAALAEVALGPLLAVAETMALAWQHASRIEAILIGHVGSAQALNLDVLISNVKRGYDFLQEQVALRSASSMMPEASARVAGALASGHGGAISSTHEVIQMLDKILDYYQRYEPSSPVPLLLERTKRLVPMNFLQLIEELTPEGMGQLLVISGPQHQDE